jgi:predicted nucleotidyltransferase
MNTASQWRYAIAQQLAPVYAPNPHVAAILVGGSTARGHADRYSDIELGVFWHQPPTQAERQAAADRMVREHNADLIRLYPYDPVEEVWSDDFMIGKAQRDQPRSGILLEVAHYTTEFLDRTFASVLQHFDTDALKQNLIAGIVDGIPLHHEQLVRDWQVRAAAYPQALAVAVVNRYAQIDHFWRWEMWLQRSANLMMLYHSFSQIQQQLLHVLLGLNRAYYFGFKWLDVIADRLAHKPEDLVRRFARVYQVEPAIGARELASLVEETYDLIEQHLPQVDVDRLRLIFRYQRPKWDHVPPA